MLTSANDIGDTHVAMQGCASPCKRDSEEALLTALAVPEADEALGRSAAKGIIEKKRNRLDDLGREIKTSRHDWTCRLQRLAKVVFATLLEVILDRIIRAIPSLL